MHFRTSFIQVNVLAIPTQWYHLVFNYMGTSSENDVVIYHDRVAVGSSAQISLNTYAGQGVVVLGKYYVQALEQDFASVMFDELLFFNRRLTPAEVQIL